MILIKTILICAFLTLSVPAFAQNLDKIFADAAEKHDVPVKYLRAVCWVESKHKPYAYRHNDKKAGTHAFGICQILNSTAKRLEKVEKKCNNSFKEKDKNNTKEKCSLFDPEKNIRIAAKYLKSKHDKYNDWYKAIAAYNTGRYLVCKTGWLHYKGKPWKRCIVGGPANLYYLNEVRKAVEENR